MASLSEKKWSEITGHLFFAVLFAFAFQFYQERMLHYDPAYFSFMVLQEQTFSIALGRWGSAFSQWLPLLASMKGCSLEDFLKLYSVSFILVYYTVFLVIQYVFKSPRFVWGLILFLVLTFRKTFFYATAELYIGSALAFLLPLILVCGGENRKKQAVAFTGFAALVVVISFFHQLAVFPALFILLLSMDRWKTPFFPKWAGISWVVVWFAVRIKLFSNSSYEKEKMPGFGELLDQLPRFFELPSWLYFEEYILPWIAWILLLAVVTVAIALMLKKWWMVLVSVSFPVGFWVLWVLAFYRGESEMMYQNYFSLYGIFIGFPLILVLHDLFRGRNPVKYIIPVVLIAISFIGIYRAHCDMAERTRFLERLTNYGRQFENKKYVLSAGHQDAGLLAIPWAFAFETLMFSSQSSPLDGVSFYASPGDATGDMETVKGQQRAFLGPHFSPLWYTSNSLHPGYFRLPEKEYLLLNTGQDRLGTDSALVGKIEMGEPVLWPMKDRPDRFVAEITLLNHSESVLPSVPGDHVNIVLGFHVLDAGGKMVRWDNNRTKLEVDLHPGKPFVQRVVLDMHGMPPGEYIAEIDMVTEGIRWWGFNRRIPVLIN